MFWTSGVSLSAKAKSPGNVISVKWCSTKSVTKFNKTLARRKKMTPECLGFDFKQNKLILADCKKRAYVFCEVKLQHSTLSFNFIFNMIFSLFANNQTARLRKRVKEMYC